MVAKQSNKEEWADLIWILANQFFRVVWVCQSKVAFKKYELLSLIEQVAVKLLQKKPKNLAFRT